MEPMQQNPSDISKTYLKLHTKLLGIQAEVVQFADLPSHTPSVNELAKHIGKKLSFLRKQLTAERDSNRGLLPYDLLEIETRLVELEAEFYRANLNNRNVVLVENDDVVVEDDVVLEKADEDYDSDSGSICASCLNDDLEPEIEPKSVYGVPEMVHQVVVPKQKQDVFRESLTSTSDQEKVEEILFECKCKKTGGGMGRRRQWWRMVVFLMLVSAVVSLSTYFDNNQHEGFLTPT